MTPRERVASLWRHPITERLATALLLSLGGFFLAVITTGAKDHRQVELTRERVSVDSARIEALYNDRQPLRQQLRSVQLSLCSLDGNPISREQLECPSTLSPSRSH